MNSLRARSVPAQLIVGIRARSASGVATSALSPTAGPTIMSTPCATSSAKACSIANAVPAGRPEPGGVDELDVAIESAALARSSMASRMNVSHSPPSDSVLLGRVGHVVQDADPYRCSHGCPSEVALSGHEERPFPLDGKGL